MSDIVVWKTLDHCAAHWTKPWRCEEIAFFQAIRAVIAKATTSEARLTQENRNAVLKQILDNAVVAEGVEDIFRLAGLERPNIGVLSDAFLDEVRRLPQKNFAVELLKRLLADQVMSRLRTNMVLEQAERLSEGWAAA